MECIWRLCVFSCFLLLLPVGRAITPSIHIVESIVNITISDSTVSEGGTFELCAMPLVNDTLSISYSITPSDRVNMNQGMFSLQFRVSNCSTIMVTDDDCMPDNDDGILNIIVTVSTNETMVTRTVNVTVTDNDADVSVTLNPTRVTLIESESVRVCASIPSPACEDITFQLIPSEDSVMAEDYMIDPPSNVTTIVKGNSSVCITVTAATNNDAENLTISWQPNRDYVNFTSGNGTVITIRQRPRVNFQLDSYEFSESSGVQNITVMISEALGGNRSASVNVNVASGTDDRFTLLTTSVTFDNSLMTVPVQVDITNNDFVEMNSTLTLALSVTSGPIVLGNNPNTTITITDDDMGQINVSLSMSVSEADGMVALCLTPTVGIKGGTTVSFSVVNGTAIENIDFNAGTTSSVMIPSMSTAQVCVNITLEKDGIIEPPENFSVNWTLDQSFNGRLSLSSSTTTVTILDSDTGSVVVEESATLMEGMGVAQVCANLTSALARKPDGESYTLTYTTDNSTDDFTLMPAILDISSTDSTSRHCISVNISDDSLVEGREMFTVTWSLGPGVPSGLTLTRNTTRVTIQDNDRATIGFEPMSYSVMEGETVSVVVKVLSGALHTTVVVRVMTGPGSGFQQIDKTISFSDSKMMETVNIITIDDTDVEDNEQFLVRLTTTDPLVDLVNNMATVSITDNDMVSSPTPPSPTPPSPPPAGGLSTPALIGIIAGGVGLAILFLIAILICVCIARLRVNRQGFYVTNEDKTEAPQMLRYSASLRSLSSQPVMPVDARDKENEYMV